MQGRGITQGSVCSQGHGASARRFWDCPLRGRRAGGAHTEPFPLRFSAPVSPLRSLSFVDGNRQPGVSITACSAL